MRGAFRFAALCAGALAVQLLPSHAQAWEWFRSESNAVTRGNEHYQAKRYDDAVKAYDEALKKHPDEPGVQLDKGTALLAKKEYGPARDALRSASRGHVDPEIRSRALYNLGLSFLDEADALGKAENLEESQARLRESVDAFKAALRAKPGNADAAWNLDLARRRLVELDKKNEEKKKEDEQKKDDQQKKDDENQADAGKPDDASGDGGAGQPEGDHEADAGKPPPDDEPGDGGAPQPGHDAAAPAPAEPGDGGKPEAAEGPSQQAPEPPRDAMDRALDALREGEESLQKHRANARARQRPERVVKDW